MEEYEEKAVSLALNKPKLQALTKELRASRLTCPLFDTMRWVSLPHFLTLYLSSAFYFLTNEFSWFTGEESGEVILQNVEPPLLWAAATTLQGVGKRPRIPT